MLEHHSKSILPILEFDFILSDFLAFKAIPNAHPSLGPSIDTELCLVCLTLVMTAHLSRVFY